MSVACYHIGLQWVALLLALIMSSTVLMTYLISVNRGHVNAELPFISSTGAYPPESCIFGEGLNLAAFLSFICAFFWYLIALERTKFMGTHQPRCLLKFMVIISLIAAIGLTLVGNFQQVNVELIHDIGAGMAFYGTTCYILLCALVSQRYLGTHWCIWIFRLLLGIAATIATIMFSVCHTVSRINFNGTQEESLIYRHPGQGGFSFYLCSTSFEWVAGFFIILFFITWAYEFRLYAIQLPQIIRKSSFEPDLCSAKS
ncbi:DNA damage-regulated autophagy modulator protein 2 [Schistosoma japonicum]|nr:DNA damage-regulated autophagy modulator protein 2 [Schistosoma japonicum]KAH8853120.1 DNA damage-regulated autophagy modulator protein 2 [Schistosoma japonicum]